MGSQNGCAALSAQLTLSAEQVAAFADRRQQLLFLLPPGIAASVWEYTVWPCRLNPGFTAASMGPSLSALYSVTHCSSKIQSPYSARPQLPPDTRPCLATIKHCFSILC